MSYLFTIFSFYDKEWNIETIPLLSKAKGYSEVIDVFDSITVIIYLHYKISLKFMIVNINIFGRKTP